MGGADTTAATLSFLFYHLANDPSQVQKLRDELEPLLDMSNVLKQKDIPKAQHLNGVIQEALRMHPAIPSGFPRLTPPRGDHGRRYLYPRGDHGGVASVYHATR